MKKLFVLALITIVFILGCEKSVNTPAGPEQSALSNEYVLFFSQELNESELLQLVQDYNISGLTELRFKIGDITAGYVPRSNDIKAEIQNGLQVHIEHTNKILAIEREHKLAKSTSQESAAKQARIVRLEKSVDLASSNNFEFSGINIQDFEGAIVSRLTDAGIVSGSFVKGAQLNKSQLNKITGSDDNWAPDYGWNSVTQSYTYQRFAFDDLSGFNVLNAYEHETHVWSTQFVDYDGYWGTDMPYGYLDTQLLDSGWPENYTVGSTDPTNFQTYYTYYTYIALKPVPGGATVAPIHIKGQKGAKSATYCHGSTWCVLYALATTGRLDDVTAPIYNHYWTY